MDTNYKDIKVSLVKSDHEQNLGSWSLQQHSGIVLYHEPTKVTVSCTKHKSQWKNKAEAMEMLEDRLTEDESTNNLLFIADKIAKLKASLGSYESLTLEEYDFLYGDIEEIQGLLFEVTHENTTDLRNC